MLDISSLLEEIKASPYVEFNVVAPHCGVVTFPDIKDGTEVSGPSGQWKEKNGTVLARLERERNVRPLYAAERAELVQVNRDLEGRFVEAGTELMRLRHFLSREEVLNVILQKSLTLFTAPERARYYFIPSVDAKVKNSGPQSVQVTDGMELFIMSRMKRELPLRYSGPDGVIYAVYFSHNRNVDAGEPLIGVCPPDQVAQIEEVGMRVQTEWPER